MNTDDATRKDTERVHSIHWYDGRTDTSGISQVKWTESAIEMMGYKIVEGTAEDVPLSEIDGDRYDPRRKKNT